MKVIMKKNIGIIILLVSILLSIILITLKPEIEVESTVKKLPYVKTKKIISQTINATISSQGVIAPETSLTILSELIFALYKLLIFLLTASLHSIIPFGNV